MQVHRNKREFHVFGVYFILCIIIIITVFSLFSFWFDVLFVSIDSGWKQHQTALSKWGKRLVPQMDTANYHRSVIIRIENRKTENDGFANEMTGYQNSCTYDRINNRKSQCIHRSSQGTFQH